MGYIYTNIQTYCLEKLLNINYRITMKVIKYWTNKLTGEPTSVIFKPIFGYWRLGGATHETAQDFIMSTEHDQDPEEEWANKTYIALPNGKTYECHFIQGTLGFSEEEFEDVRFHRDAEVQLFLSSGRGSDTYITPFEGFKLAMEDQQWNYESSDFPFSRIFEGPPCVEEMTYYCTHLPFRGEEQTRCQPWQDELMQMVTWGKLDDTHQDGERNRHLEFVPDSIIKEYRRVNQVFYRSGGPGDLLKKNVLSFPKVTSGSYDPFDPYWDTLKTPEGEETGFHERMAAMHEMRKYQELNRTIKNLIYSIKTFKKLSEEDKIAVWNLVESIRFNKVDFDVNNLLKVLGKMFEHRNYTPGKSLPGYVDAVRSSVDHTLRVIKSHLPNLFRPAPGREYADRFENARKSVHHEVKLALTTQTSPVNSGN